MINTKKIYLPLALTAVAANLSFGIDIDVTQAGTLCKLVDNPGAVTELKLSGPINAADMKFIGTEMTALTRLDLSQASITAYSDLPLDGRTIYPAGTIPAGAFAGLPLVEFTLPAEGPLTIGDGAFMNTAITALSLPANVDSVGAGAFAGCAALVKADMPTTAHVGIGMFEECTALQSVNLGNTTILPRATFRHCTSLSDVTGADNLTVIGDEAFEGDTSLTTFEFGPGLTYLGASSFAGTGLAEAFLSLCSSLHNIGDQAFAGAPTTTVVFPDNLTTVGNGAFFDNTSLTDVCLPATVISVGDHSFKGVSADTLLLPDNLENIGNHAFLGMDKVTTMILPPTLISIGDNAMENMTGLASINATQLTSIPQTGSDVWQGVNQPDVRLVIMSDMETQFKSAPQWQDFTFDVISGIDDPTADTSAQSVKGRFDGADLHIAASGADIVSVSLFDPAGVRLTAVNPLATDVTIDTAPYPGNIFIVAVTLDNGRQASLKLAR